MSLIKENDVCILYVNDLPQGFIRIESIEPDSKPGWYSVQFIELMFPIQVIKWKIDEEHLKGADINMKGFKFNLQLLNCQIEKKQSEEVLDANKPNYGKVINLVDWKTNHKIKEPPQEIV